MYTCFQTKKQNDRKISKWTRISNLQYTWIREHEDDEEDENEGLDKGSHGWEGIIFWEGYMRVARVRIKKTETN